MFMTNVSENPFFKNLFEREPVRAAPPRMLLPPAPLPPAPAKPDPREDKRGPTAPSLDVKLCPQVVTKARSPSGEEKNFPSPCHVPKDWAIIYGDRLKEPEKSAPAPTPPREGTLGDYLMGLATGSSVPATGTPSVVVSPDQQPRSLLLPLVGALALGGIVWYTMKQRKEGKDND